MTSFILVCINGGLCTHTRFADPLKITVELPLDLLLSSQLQELSPVLHTLSLFGELAANTHTHDYGIVKSIPMIGWKHIKKHIFVTGFLSLSLSSSLSTLTLTARPTPG